MLACCKANVNHLEQQIQCRNWIAYCLCKFKHCWVGLMSNIWHVINNVCHWFVFHWCAIFKWHSWSTYCMYVISQMTHYVHYHLLNELYKVIWSSKIREAVSRYISTTNVNYSFNCQKTRHSAPLLTHIWPTVSYIDNVIWLHIILWAISSAGWLMFHS